MLLKPFKYSLVLKRKKNKDRKTYKELIRLVWFLLESQYYFLDFFSRNIEFLWKTKLTISLESRY